MLAVIDLIWDIAYIAAMAWIFYKMIRWMILITRAGISEGQLVKILKKLAEINKENPKSGTFFITVCKVEDNKEYGKED